MNKLLGIYNDEHFSNTINLSNFYKFRFNFNSFLIFSFGLLFILSVVYILSILRFEMYIIPAVIGVVLIPFFFIFPKFWIYTVTFSTIAFFGETEDGLSVFDVITGIFYIGGLVVWFFTEIIVNKRKIIEDSWEFIFLCFFLLFPLTYLGTFDNDLDFLDWFRGYVLYTLMLYYFPLKKLLTKNEDWFIFAYIFVFVTFLTGIKQIYFYYTNIISDLKYAYQIGTSIRYNQLLFSFILSFLFLVFFEIKSKFKQIILFVIISIVIIALATSFSRIFWTTTGVCILFSFIKYRFVDKLKFTVIIAATGLVFYLALSLFLKDNLSLGVQLLNKRVSSTSSGTKDPSANARFVEWEMVIQKIKESPIVGQGINKYFKHNSPLFENTVYHNTIHNGYLHMMYFFGVPLGLLFILLMLYKFYESIFLFFSIKDKTHKYIIISSIYFYIIFFVVCFFTSEFHKRDDVFLIPLVFAMIYFVKHNNNNLIEN